MEVLPAGGNKDLTTSNYEYRRQVSTDHLVGLHWHFLPCRPTADHTTHRHGKALSGWPHHRDTERLCPADHTTETQKGSVRLTTPQRDTERLCPADHTTERRRKALSGWPHHTDTERHKLQALVYNILPSTTAVFIYAIGSIKLSANEQFFVGAQTVVRLLQTTQIKQGVS